MQPVKRNNCGSRPVEAPPLTLLKDKYLSEFKTEYEKALARKNLGIKDCESGGGTVDSLDASKVTYTNTTLNATNVQEALDALTSMIGSGTPVWKYTLTCNPSTVYYGTKTNVTFSYSINSSDVDLAVTFDGVGTNKTSGSVTKTLTKPESVTLKAHSSSLGDLNKSIAPNFVYKYFYCFSQNETYNNEELHELTSNSTIDCGDTECYVYCIVRKDSVIIKDPNFGLEDSGAFIKEKDYTLPKGTFNNQVEDVTGYKILRSDNKLTGKWTIKL